jgi:antirestriction protein ArdC
VTQSASYIGNWLSALRADKRFIFAAAKLATQAAGFIYPNGEPASGDQLAS